MHCDVTNGIKRTWTTRHASTSPFSCDFKNNAGSEIWRAQPRTRFAPKSLESASSCVTGRQNLNGIKGLALLKTSCPKLLDIPSKVPHSRDINMSVLRKFVTFTHTKTKLAMDTSHYHAFDSPLQGGWIRGQKNGPQKYWQVYHGL
jgi:hypothetical protein